MGGWKVSPAKWRTCICGRVCKGGAAMANHGRKCPMEVARSEAVVKAVCEDRRPPTHAEFRAAYLAKNPD